MLFGSGGIKKFGTKKNTDNLHLDSEIKRMMKIEDAIFKTINDGDLGINKVGFWGTFENIELKDI